MERLQPKLGVDPRAHRFRRADQETDLASAHVTEQPLLGFGLLVVLHEGDLRCRHTEPNQLVADKTIGREAARLFDIDRAEIGEDHLGSAR